MGGGDLNSKKSWHPNTMKNQERVWKAEQAAAEEKKRMVELQRERAEERDRTELNSLMKHSSNSPANDNRLSWMYDKPDKKVDHESYLLGKSIDKNAEQADKVEQDVIPAVSRRVVGSSMLTSAGDTQVDMSRKIREDPLHLIKERERAARAALLNNPLQRRRLTELLRKEQDLRKESKSKKSPKKKDKNLDDLLAAKLNALGGQKSIDLATLLNSDDSSGNSSPEDKKQKKKKKKSKQKSKKKERKHSSHSDSDYEKSTKYKKDCSIDKKKSKKRSSEHRDEKKESRKRKSSENEHSGGDVTPKKFKGDAPKCEDPRADPRGEYDTSYKKSRYDDTKHYNSGQYSGRQFSRDEERQTRDGRQYSRDEERQSRDGREYSRDEERQSRDGRQYSRDEERPSRDGRQYSRDEERQSRNSRQYSRDEERQSRNGRQHSRDDERQSRDGRQYSRDEERQSRDGRQYSRDEERQSRDGRQYSRDEERHSRDKRENKKHGGMTEEERAAKLAEMAAAGAEREVQRGRRVASQRAADAAAERAPAGPRAAPARALPDSLESRIHSTRHYIQRDKRHMNEHFARR